MTQPSPIRLPFGPGRGPGKLITIDGLDGAGKTTLTRELERYLLGRGVPVLITRIPTTELREAPFFELLQRKGRTDLVDPVAFEVEYMADRIQHCRTVIGPALERGTCVISDRYALSSIGSLLLRLPELREVAVRALTVEPWFKDLCKYMIRPDLAILVHAEPSVCAARVRARHDEAAFELEPRAYAELHDLMLAAARINDMIAIGTDASEHPLTRCRPHVDRLLERWRRS